jgi:hypothetical protein
MFERELEHFSQSGRDELLKEKKKKDEKYKTLTKERADAGMALRGVLDGEGIGLFEAYTDAVYAQEVYELEAVYVKGLRE